MIKLTGNIVDIHKKEIYFGTIEIEGENILSIKKESTKLNEKDGFILPGLIDAHVHIESSMLIPFEFARAAFRQGTVATVSDPHEIANVLGIRGVEFMIENGKKSNLKFNWGVPSCVPATGFETSGAIIDSEKVKSLFKGFEIVCLSEMMNFPGVVYDDPEVRKKLEIAKQFNKPVDGHAPGLTGDILKKYVQAGITTDHECTTLEEAKEKIENGMKILIREGSSAKNLNALCSLIDLYPEKVMFCCDDIHPEDLIEGHINKLLKKAVSKGANIFNIIRAATINVVNHYNLNVGLLRVNDKADLIVVNNLNDFDVNQTWINGKCVYKKGQENEPSQNGKHINNFVSYPVSKNDIKVVNEKKNFKAIEVIDGELITKNIIVTNTSTEQFLNSDTENDINKVVVVNRYQKAKPVVGFVKNFGLKKGALASSVAHDSHNIIAVGVDDNDIAEVINLLMESRGGIAVVNNIDRTVLPLGVAGLMSTERIEYVSDKYLYLNKKVKELGSSLRAPFMTMSFLALLVIPELKIGDKGLFDVNKFQFTSLFE
jgi:adenine deaminase